MKLQLWHLYHPNKPLLVHRFYHAVRLQTMDSSPYNILYIFFLVFARADGVPTRRHADCASSHPWFPAQRPLSYLAKQSNLKPPLTAVNPFLAT